jgi:hypothetical protein
VNYNQLTPEQKVQFYNDLCEEPFSGDPANVVPATSALLKASGWGIDEINDNFKQFVEENHLNDGQPAKCTVDLGLEEPPPPAAPAAAQAPAKRNRKKATVPAQAQVPAEAGAAAGDGAEASVSDAPKKSGLIPREPKLKDDQMLYPGLGEIKGIRYQLRQMLGEGCTMAQLIEKYKDLGVSTASKVKDNHASFVRGYVNVGLRPEVDMCRTSPVTPEERAAAAAKAAEPAPATLGAAPVGGQLGAGAAPGAVPG